MLSVLGPVSLHVNVWYDMPAAAAGLLGTPYDVWRARHGMPGSRCQLVTTTKCQITWKSRRIDCRARYSDATWWNSSNEIWLGTEHGENARTQQQIHMMLICEFFDCKELDYLKVRSIYDFFASTEICEIYSSIQITYQKTKGCFLAKYIIFVNKCVFYVFLHVFSASTHR